MDTKPKKDGRKVLLVNPEFQLSFLKLTCSVAALVIFVFYGANKYLFWLFVKKGESLGLPADHIFFRFLSQQQMKMDIIFLVSAVVAAVILVLFGLHLSNRVAGPIHRLKTHLNAIKEGATPTPVAFRKDDYFQELAEVVNECLVPQMSNKNKS